MTHIVYPLAAHTSALCFDYMVIEYV